MNHERAVSETEARPGARAAGAVREFFFPERGVLRPGPFTVVALGGLVLGLLLGFADSTQRLEWALYDRFLSVATREGGPAPRIVIVAIDELSMSEVQVRWPWPRRYHAALIEELAKAGARTIVMDMTFSEPDKDPRDDAAFVEAVKAAGNVIVGTDRTMVVDTAYTVLEWKDPFPGLAQAAAGIGAVDFKIDPDNVLRRAELTIDDRPTLALAAARREPGFAAPGNPSEPTLVHFNGPPRQGIKTVSYYQAIDAANSLPAGIFTDAIVFVGRSLPAAAALNEREDYFATPVGLRTPGVEVHANVLDTILRGRQIADPFGDLAALLGLCAVLGILAASVLYRLGPMAGLALAIGAGAAFAAAGFFALAGSASRLPVLSPALTLVGVYAATASYRFALGKRERRLIRRAFQHYVAPAIVEQMLADPSKLTLGGEEYEVTVIFTDLEGFTTLSEKLTPEELRSHLSGYFKAMLDLLLAERATLDKLIGDAIMVYFGCPIRDAAHASQACRAALAMQRRMVDLNRSWAGRGLPPLWMRVGVNTGRAIAGNYGTDTIFNYTILGDCVNLASRLEGVNKEYGTLTIIGEETWAKVRGGFEVRELDLIRVKGKVEPVAIYELAAPAGELPPARRELFARFASGLTLYRARRWEEAGAEFRAALDLDPSDGPAATFLRRCLSYHAAPPPPDWDGAHLMKTK